MLSNFLKKLIIVDSEFKSKICFINKLQFVSFYQEKKIKKIYRIWNEKKIMQHSKACLVISIWLEKKIHSGMIKTICTWLVIAHITSSCDKSLIRLIASTGYVQINLGRCGLGFEMRPVNMQMLAHEIGCIYLRVRHN
jgi:hypothetical protein